MLSKQKFDSVCAKIGLPLIDKAKYQLLAPYYETLAPMFVGDIKAYGLILPEIEKKTGLTQYEINYLVAVNLVPMQHEAFRVRGIPEKIFWDSVGDLALQFKNCRKINGQFGIHNHEWLFYHVKSMMFRIGRLKFAPLPLDFEVPGVPYGSDTLTVHIPEGKDLNIDEVREAFAVAPGFFKEYFDRDIKLIYCHSWLLHPSLKKLLGENSNILKFQNEFEILRVYDDTKDGMGWIFGRGVPVGGPYPQNTSLQRNAAKYLAEGGVLGTALGIIRL